MSSDVRSKGQVYTPRDVVRMVLDRAGYSGAGILRMHVMENSCGRGAFLAEIAERYSREYISSHGSSEGLSEELSAYIHGVDIDKDNVRASREALDETALRHGCEHVQWDVSVGDALDFRHRGMDFVIGNPPYVSLRNMDESQKRNVSRYGFGSVGAPDLYMVFFEVGLRMLRPGGILAYITPSTYMHVHAAAPLRARMRERRELVSLTDVHRYDAFSDAQTSAVVTVMERARPHDDVELAVWSKNGLSDVESVPYDSLFMDDRMTMVSDDARRERFKAMMSSGKGRLKAMSGAMTGMDRAFFDEKGEGIGSGPYIRRAYKARKGVWYECICPYDREGRLAPFEALPSEARARLQRFSEELRSRPCVLSGSRAWYEWANPSDAVKSSLRRVAVSNLVTDLSSVRAAYVPEGSVVYGSPSIDLRGEDAEEVLSALRSQEFVDYVQDLHKIKGEGPTADGRGTKYEYTVEDLDRYLAYRFPHD